jgi:alpha-tubulin suppressor-like RCC1 family protein
MRLRSFAVTLLLLVGLVGSALVVSAASPTPPAPAAAVRLAAATPCADLLLVGSSGSGEGPSPARPFGSTLGVARDRIIAAAAVEGRTVASRYVGTHTAGVSTLRTRASGPVTSVVTPRSVKAWEGDLGDAASRVVEALVAAAGSCPHQEIVLVGYAQGAMALHRALLRLPRHPGILARVVAAALIADGDRIAGTHAILAGDPIAPRRAKGLQQWARTPVADVPAPGSTAPVWSICTRTDLVCHVTRTDFAKAAAVHRAYAGGVVAGVVRTVSARIFARATRWAVPAHDPAPIVAAQDVAVSAQVPVLVAPADRDHVVFASASGLPAGLTLDEHGLLSGTPTVSGIFSVHFTVANTVSPVFDRPVPGVIEVRVLNQAPRTVSAGGEHTCSVRFDGTLWCWGRNTWGELGNADRGPGRPDPLQVGTAADWSTVAAGGGHTCATRRPGSLWCWGLNNKGQLGDGTTDVRTTPVRIGTGSSWAQLSAGWFHTCGIRTNGTAACWGENSAGQLGDGTRTQRVRPTPVPGDDWASISVGGWDTCGIRTDHTLWCWGRNDFGQLGDDTTAPKSVPTRIGVGQDWAEVSVGWAHACGVKTTGKLRCWGRGDRGQLGDGGFVSRHAPVEPAGALAATGVVAGDTHSCAFAADGTTWCWGSNDYGQLRDGTGDASGVPVLAQGSFSALSAGWLHTCGITLDGPLACWGDNDHGQLGDGTLADTIPPHSSVPATPPTDGGTHLTLATFNLLGDVHTAPYKDSDFRAPVRIRAEWQADALRELGLPDVFGSQELSEPHFDALIRATDNAYDGYPGAMNDYHAVMTTVFWLKSRWTAVAKETFRVPFINSTKLRPAVRLRNKTTGQEIWVINVHNAPQDNQEQRNEAVKIEIAKIQEKMKDGIPVFFIGDMNEKQTVLCKVLAQTNLFSPRGGTYANGVCTPPPGHLRVDWIFGSFGVTFDNYHEWRTTLIGRSTDHHLLMTGVTLPASN